MLKPGYSSVKYGLAIQHIGFTPSSISDYEILRNDHPYAGCLFLQSFNSSTDPVNKQRFSAVLSVGVIGPAAMAAEIQTGIHKALDNVHPEGWHNQVRNDLILNYGVTYEKQLLNAGNIFLIDAASMVNVGTFSDKATLGATFMLGSFVSPYEATTKADKIKIYLYDHPEASVIAYDAALQGGLFNRTSPYTLESDEIEHAVFTNRLGIAGSWRHLNLEYFQTTATRNFKEGKPHSWGGIQLGITF